MNENQVMLSELIVLNVEHRFTATENALNASELGRWLQEKEDHENRLKVIKAEFKAKIEECNAKAKQYSGYINNGTRMKEENCELWVDYDRQKRFYVSKNSGLTVKEEDMHAADFQKKIDFEEEQRRIMKVVEENGNIADFAENGPVDNESPGADPLDQVISDRANGVYHTDEFEQSQNPNVDPENDDLFKKSDD